MSLTYESITSIKSNRDEHYRGFDRIEGSLRDAEAPASCHT